MRHAGSPSGRKIVARYVEYLIENPYDPSVKYARPKRKVHRTFKLRGSYKK